MNVYRSLAPSWLLLFSLCSVVVAGESRTWTDVTGTTIQGELIDVTSNHHALLRVDGETVSIPLAIFSKEDQRHLKSWRKEAPSQSDMVSATSQAEEADKPQHEPSPMITPDNYTPPKLREENYFACSNCDHELSDKIGVGDHCPHCDILLEYEEDENGNVIAGTKETPWYIRATIRIGAAILTAGTIGLWKLRHLLFLPFSASQKESEPFDIAGDLWQKPS